MPAEQTRTPSLVVLGADAVLAALPATAVQLAHACRAAGFDAAVPTTWGDELVAHACARAMAERGDEPAIFCACPRVAERLVTDGGDLDRFLVSLVAPPVATARYLRALAKGQALHLTFVGTCPSGADPEFDQRFTPTAFLAWLAERGISVTEQPTVFDGVLPPDRRRHLSQPGGLPTAEALARAGAPHEIVELFGDDYATELAERLLNGGRVLLDVSPRLGCACSGAVEGVAPRTARPVLVTLEPPRATGAVVDHALPVALERPLPEPGSPQRAEPAAPVRALAEQRAARRTTPRGVPAVNAPEPRAERETPRRTPAIMGRATRLTPVGMARLGAHGVPRAIDAEGKRLPRAYVARRRTASGSMPAVPEPTPATTTATVTPPDTPTYDDFVAGVAATVASEMPPWRTRLGDAIAFWRSRGYVTAVLERAYALPKAPDVEGLLNTYAAAVEHLREVERVAVALDPRAAGATAFRDPERVADAEAILEALRARRCR